jgi:hypothetical protein
MDTSPKDGELSQEEITAGTDLPEDLAGILFESLDTDKSGTVSQEELAEQRTELTSDDKTKLLEVVGGIQEAYRPLKTVASVLKEGKYTSSFTRAFIGAAKTAAAVSLAVYALPAIGVAISSTVAATLVTGIASATATAITNAITSKSAKAAGLVSRGLRKDQEVPAWLAKATDAAQTVTGLAKSWFAGVADAYQGVKGITMSRDNWRKKKLKYIKLMVNAMMLLREAISEAEVYVKTKYILSFGQQQPVDASAITPKGKGSHSVTRLGITIGFTSYKNMAQIINKAEAILADADKAIEEYLSKDKTGLKGRLVDEIKTELEAYRSESKFEWPVQGITNVGEALLTDMNKQLENDEDIAVGEGDVLDEPETSSDVSTITITPDGSTDGSTDVSTDGSTDGSTGSTDGSTDGSTGSTDGSTD